MKRIKIFLGIVALFCIAGLLLSTETSAAGSEEYTVTTKVYLPEGVTYAGQSGIIEMKEGFIFYKEKLAGLAEDEEFISVEARIRITDSEGDPVEDLDICAIELGCFEEEDGWYYYSNLEISEDLIWSFYVSIDQDNFLPLVMTIVPEDQELVRFILEDEEFDPYYYDLHILTYDNEQNALDDSLIDFEYGGYTFVNSNTHELDIVLSSWYPNFDGKDVHLFRQEFSSSEDELTEINLSSKIDGKVKIDNYRSFPSYLDLDFKLTPLSKNVRPFIFSESDITSLYINSDGNSSTFPSDFYLQMMWCERNKECTVYIQLIKGSLNERFQIDVDLDENNQVRAFIVTNVSDEQVEARLFQLTPTIRLIGEEEQEISFVFTDDKCGFDGGDFYCGFDNVKILTNDLGLKPPQIGV